MVLQFTDEWGDQTGFHQDPTWWVEIDTALEWGLAARRPDVPVAVLYHLNPRPPVTPACCPSAGGCGSAPGSGKGRSVNATLDGSRLGGGSVRQYPVDPRRRDRRWIFGVGNYTHSADGPLWIDAASFTPSR